MSLNTHIIGSMTLWDLIVISVTIVIAILIAQLISVNLKRVFAGRLHGKDIDIIVKILYWAVVIAALFIIISQLRIDLSGLLIAGGFLGIVIGFATQSVVGNLVSGIFILTERPINIGDEILIGDLGGYVEDIRVLSTLIRTYDGVYTRVPNQEVFTSKITNYVAYPARRVEYSIGLDYREDLGKVRQIILGVLAGSYYSLVRPEPEINVSAIADNRIAVTVHFWTPSQLFTPAKYAVLEEIQEALARGSITVPPPARQISLTGGDLAGGLSP
ncbi:MAG TPA: mechanosensitive ion channel family protein [Methanomicrobiales archaeon]|jgi:small-conductance mechanosensitive channel|nr:mechanosensitive ion channel family protein [Methanomicrobiales archaeon]